MLKLGFRNELLQEQASKLKRALEFVVQQNEEEKEKKEQTQCEGGVSADEEGVDMSDEA